MAKRAVEDEVEDVPTDVAGRFYARLFAHHDATGAPSLLLPNSILDEFGFRNGQQLRVRVMRSTRRGSARFSIVCEEL